MEYHVEINNLVKCRLPQDLAELIRSSRPFMLTIAKAKTAKLSKYHLIPMIHIVY